MQGAKTDQLCRVLGAKTDQLCRVQRSIFLEKHLIFSIQD